LYFCDFDGELADAVREGRRREFARFPAFADPEARARIPDPMAPETFETSRLHWSALDTPTHTARLTQTTALLALRPQEIVALLRAGRTGVDARVIGARGLDVTWQFGDDGGLRLIANLGAEPVTGFVPGGGRCLWQRGDAAASLADGELAGWAGAWYRIGT